MGYTLRQFHDYLSLSFKRERLAQRNLINAVALGSAGGDAMHKTLAALEKD